MIAQARERVAQAANAALTMLYWRIGKRIHHEVLGDKRADYGMWIVAPLRRQLGWTHFKALIPLKDALQRDFYAEMCRVERWSTRTLAEKIDSMVFERTAISKKPEEVARAELAELRADDRLTPDLVLRDPYILAFLGLRDRYLEKDLEDAILRELETFLIELGQGFAFLGRQIRIQVDSDDFYLNLPRLLLKPCFQLRHALPPTAQQFEALSQCHVLSSKNENCGSGVFLSKVRDDKLAIKDASLGRRICRQ